MVGKKVVHVETGEIKTIAEYDLSGYVEFTDGKDGDIHLDQNPYNQAGKLWRYLEENTIEVEKTFNEDNLKLLREGKVTIKIPDYNGKRFYEPGRFNKTINPILQAAGLKLISTSSNWKYVYKHDIGDYLDTEVDYEDAISSIPSGRSRKYLLIEDFYLDEPIQVEVSVNYEIY